MGEGGERGALHKNSKLPAISYACHRHCRLSNRFNVGLYDAGPLCLLCAVPRLPLS